MSIDKIKDFERKFDAEIKELPILKDLPARAILTNLHVLIDNMLHMPDQNKQGNTMPGRSLGESLAGRLAYLVPLLANGRTDEICADGMDAFRVFQQLDPERVQMRKLIEYAHVCEIMPEVWRGSYVVDVDDTDGFVLKHESSEQEQWETLDIVLSELALPHLKSIPKAPSVLFDRLAKLTSFPGELILVAKKYSDFYRDHVSESPIMSNSGYVAATGIGIEKFENFRSALLGIAAACTSMARAHQRRLILNPQDQASSSEYIEWASVNWNANFFQGLLLQLSGLTLEELGGIVPLFSLDFRKHPLQLGHANDGYFPPIAWIGPSVFFNPSLLQAFLPARNILFALNKIDKKRFDSLVSCHMEPELLRQADAILRRLPGVIVISNVNWVHGAIKGELDLLVFSKGENMMLHVQAKAAIPAQGSRMTKALEGRIAEGIEQLARFRRLPGAEIDRIVGSATGLPVSEVGIVDVILTRSSCGTHRIWSRLNNVVVVNLPLLSAVQRKIRHKKLQSPLRRLAEIVLDEVARVMNAIRPDWITEKHKWGNKEFTIPVLKYDDRAMQRERAAMSRHLE